MAFSRKNAYDFVKVIGCGGMGSVELWRRKVLDEGLVVAKRVYLGDRMREEEEEAKREAQVLRRLCHPHIVKYLGSWVSQESYDLIIVQEYCEGGDLSELIQEERKGRAAFPAADVIRWLSQIAHALLYCHTTVQVLHRDLKPGNVFLSGDRSRALLGDFGVARALESTKALVNTFIGTEAYMSPEVLRMQSYGLKSDVWGLGTIFYELCSLRKLFEPSRGPLDLVQAMMAYERPPPLPGSAGYPEDFEELCRQMLTKDVDIRPALPDLLAQRGPLREAVLELEQEIDWPESLVPPLASDGSVPEAGFAIEVNGEGPAAAPSAAYEEAGGSLADLQADALPRDPTFPGSVLLRRGGQGAPRLAPPHLSLAEEPSESATTRPSSTCSSRPLSSFAAGAAARLKAGRCGASNASASTAATPAAGEEETDDPQLPPRATIAEFPPWLRFNAPGRGGQDVSDEAAVHEAAQIQDLLELTVRRQELEAMVVRVFSEPGLEEEGEAPATPPGPLPGPPLPQARPATAAAAEQEADARRDGTQRNAAKVWARLRSVEALRTEEPDPGDLQDTLSCLKDMDLAAEDCGQAVLAHAHRLSMKAEDAITREDSPVPAMEEAVDLLEAMKADVLAAPSSIEIAGKRLLNAYELRRQVGIRCICGNQARMLSIWRHAPLTEVLAQVAGKWRRQVEGLELGWGPAVLPLLAEEDWQKCLAAHPRGPIHLHLAPERHRTCSAGKQSRSKRTSLAALKVASGRARDEAVAGVLGAGPVLQVPAPGQRPKAALPGNWRLL